MSSSLGSTGYRVSPVNYLHENFGEEEVFLQPFSTHALKSPGATVWSFCPSLVFGREKGWHEGSPTLVIYLAFLAFCTHPGTIPNWQGLKASNLRPRPCSPCPETTGRWHLRGKCNGFLVDSEKLDYIPGLIMDILYCSGQLLVAWYKTSCPMQTCFETTSVNIWQMLF